MSPEQAKGYRVKGSADQFSVAVMVYRLLTGERPFMGDSRSTVMYKIVHEDPITLNVLNRTIPAGVSAAVMKALGKDPTQRFPTCSPLPPRFEWGWRAGPSSSLLTRMPASARLCSWTRRPPQALPRSLSRRPPPLGPL